MAGILRLGIDLGGTKISAVVLDNKGHELHRERADTPRGDYKATLGVITDLVAVAERRFGQCTVGLATPGAPAKHSGLMKNCNSTCLNGQPLQKDLEQALGRTVRLANDADCFTLTETLEGAGEDAASVFGVIIGTGVGGGLCINASLLSGPNAVSGEWGHNPMPWPLLEKQIRRYPQLSDPRPCYCGRENCIETFLSGEGLLRTWHTLPGACTLENVQALVLKSEKGDTLATEAIELYSEQLAAALAQVINIVDPEVVVLGGGLSNISSLYGLVPKYWGEWVFSDTVLTRLRRAELGDDSGVRGAACLWV